MTRKEALMSKRKTTQDETQDEPTGQPERSMTETKKARTRLYTFPDFEGDGPSITIASTSTEDATRRYHQQKGAA
jgi:hypothetical protein